METIIPNWIKPPRFEDEQKDQRARLLNVLFVAVLIAIPLGILGNLSGGISSYYIYLINGCGFILVLGLMALLRRGYVNLAGNGFIFLASFLVTIAGAQIGTIRAPYVCMYILIVMAAGLLIDRIAMMIAAAISSFAILGLILAEKAGLLPTPDLSVGITQWFSLSIFLALTGVCISRALRIIHGALERTQNELAERRLVEKALRESEARYRQLNVELEERVQQRTARLMAVIAELESFSYSVAHDLRSPLRSIDGYSRIAMEDPNLADNPDTIQSMENIRIAAQRMGALIDDLLRLSSVTRRELKYTQVSLSAIAETTIASLHRQVPNRHVDISIQPDLTAIGDSNLLRIVMENLLDNAWKFTSLQKQTQIEFGVIEKDLGPIFFVRDNGPGFDMVYASKIFEPFQRLHFPEEFAGTGIGLASVKRIIERHGGQVWAEATPGNGATFFFTIPDQRPSETQPDHLPQSSKLNR